ncbi:MAG: tetratricopeptide repeat protein [Acidobacteriota bacterium]|jgi:tetratricopeptide (TPR) repeat protein
MDMKSKFSRHLVAVATGLFFLTVLLYAQNPQEKEDVPTIEDAMTFNEAYEWVAKAEALMGTPEENSDEQAEYYLKATQIKPDFLEAHYNLGLIYMNQEKMKEAAHEFEEVLKINPAPEIEGIHFLMASAYRVAGDNEKAIGALEKGLQLIPDDTKMLQTLARLQVDAQMDDAAVRNLMKLIESDPADLASRMDLAIVYQRNNKLEDAAEQYAIVSKAAPDNYAAHYNMALVYMQQRKYPEASEKFEAADRIQPHNPVLLELLGDAYAGQQMLEKAIDAYTSALESDTEKGKLFTKLGFAFSNLDRVEEAVDALENAVKFNSVNPDVFYLLGDLYSELEQKDKAVAAYRKSLELKPDQKEVRYNLGTLFAGEERFAESLEELKAAVELDPQYAPAWINIALVSQKLGQDNDAIEAHEKVIALGHGTAMNYFHLGVLYAKADKPDPSIEAFAKAVDLDPEEYLPLLLQEIKKVHSVLDPVRYDDRFRSILETQAEP